MAYSPQFTSAYNSTVKNAQKRTKRKKNPWFTLFIFQVIIQFAVKLIWDPQFLGIEAFTEAVEPLRNWIMARIWIRDTDTLLDPNYRVEIFMFFLTNGNKPWFIIAKKVLYWGPLCLSALWWGFRALGNAIKSRTPRKHRERKVVSYEASGTTLLYRLSGSISVVILKFRTLRSKWALKKFPDLGLWISNVDSPIPGERKDSFLTWNKNGNCKITQDRVTHENTYNFSLMDGKALMAQYTCKNDPDTEFVKTNDIKTHHVRLKENALYAVGTMDPNSGKFRHHFTITWIGGSPL